MYRKPLVIVCLIALIILPAVTRGVSAQEENGGTIVEDKGITISPVRFEYNLAPGESVTGTVKLINDTFDDKTVYLTARNFKSGDESGVPLFITEQQPFEASLKDWISLEKGAVLVKRVETDDPHVERIEFRITVPENAEPGGHYAGIVAGLVPPGESIDAGEGNLAFKDERAAIILINVDGEVNRDLSTDKFYATDAFTQDKPLVSIFEWMPVGFITELRNSGNSHTVPLGHILIFSGETKIDEIDFNPADGNILRESSRSFFNRWTGALLELVPVLDEDGNEVVDGNGNVQTRFAFNLDTPRLPFGRFTAKLAIGYDDSGEKKILVDDFEFWVIPWKLLLVIALVLIAFIYYRIKKRGRK
ncbi:MAG: hypothetical protein ACE5DX_05185 [Candidatus Dojkabacteria bacterium]